MQKVIDTLTTINLLIKPKKIEFTCIPGIMLTPVNEPWPAKIDFREHFKKVLGEPNKILNNVYCWYIEWNNKIYSVMIGSRLKKAYCVGQQPDNGFILSLIKLLNKKPDYNKMLSQAYGYF